MLPYIAAFNVQSAYAKEQQAKRQAVSDSDISVALSSEDNLASASKVVGVEVKKCVQCATILDQKQ